jgi:hypothetical protein
MGSKMSFQAMAWAIRQKAPTKPKFVLLVLANYADPKGVAWPSLKVLEQDTGIKRSTLITSITTLVKLGLITKAKRYRGNLKTSNIYQLEMAETS